ncbi:hypothetical protein GCM10023171_20930 [Microbacterium panaciterrae]|uniref:Nucleotidyltransferase family protein n=1 Tax=Microbacterium panaciterrae TaxID=985759 RepID=A0ABP8PE20_9MICO
MSTATFSLADATVLAHAQMSRIARDRGIRALSVKGPIAEVYALRPPRTSADADVLIDPARHVEFCAVLEGLGWHTRIGRETPSLIPQHSTTYIHPAWPCDIDVHWMFPGFFADAAVAFEALWASRRVVTIAHAPVDAPSKAGTAVVMALHAARDLRSPRHKEEKELVSAALAGSFTADERQEFADIARVGGGTWVLRDLLVEAGLGPVDVDIDDESRRLWELFSNRVEDASSVAWWRQIRAARWWQKPRWLLRAVWVVRQDVPRNDPAVLPSWGETTAYQWQRWVRGMGATLRYVRRAR